MKKYSQEEIENLILKVGLTQASKQLKIGYDNLKNICKDLKIKVEKKKTGRKKNVILF
jgi:hypothetical protein